LTVPDTVADQPCVFCEIAAGRVPSALVDETSDALAIMNLHPFNPGHVLLLPRRHVETFWDIDAGLYGQLMTMARRLARAVSAAYRPLKVGLLVSGFDVAHAHLHVVPLHEAHDLTSRRLLDGLVSRAEAGALAAGAARIRAALEAPEAPPGGRPGEGGSGRP
jgi:histidine triad (HIT) family protein